MSSQIATKTNQDTQNTKLDTVNTNLTTIDGRVDGLETAVASTNTKLDTVNTNLGTIDGRVDGLETLVTSTNTKMDSLIAKFGAIGQQAMAASAPVSIASNQSSISTSLSAAVPAGTNNIGDVDVLTLPALVAGSALVGKVGIDQTTPGTTNGVQVNAALPAGTNAIGKLSANSGVDIGDIDITSIAAGTNRLGSVRVVDSGDADLTAIKGTQTARAVGTQDLKDSGRTAINFYAIAAATGLTTVETAITLTKSSGTAATSTGTSFVVTNGKRYRITAISFATRANAVATAQSTTFNFRINTGGAVTTSSTPVVLSARSASAATASAWDRVYIDLLEGYEITGDGTLQFGITAAATFAVNAPTWDVYISGYEY